MRALYPLELFSTDEASVLSEKEVEKELELEEEERHCQGGVVWHATSANKFVMLGLELEDCQ